MKFILDFDGVIFNTDALKKKMRELGIEESERSASLFDTLKEEDPDLQIESFIFEDAYAFLTKHKGECEIVSSFLSTNPDNNQNEDTQRVYQETKILLSGVQALVGASHVHVVGKSKKDTLRELKARFDEQTEECVFVDDRGGYVQEALELGIRAFKMTKNRETLGEAIPTFEHFTEISTLSELENRL